MKNDSAARWAATELGKIASEAIEFADAFQNGELDAHGVVLARAKIRAAGAMIRKIYLPSDIPRSFDDAICQDTKKREWPKQVLKVFRDPHGLTPLELESEVAFLAEGVLSILSEMIEDPSSPTEFDRELALDFLAVFEKEARKAAEGGQ